MTKDNNAIISTALLSKFYSDEKKDPIELLVPFVKIAIYSTTELNNKIDLSKLSLYIIENFGYETMPAQVIASCLNRISKNKQKYIIKTNNNFYYKNSLDDFYNNFSNKMNDVKTTTDYCFEKFYSFYNNREPKLSKDNTNSILVNFLYNYGYGHVVEQDLSKLNKKEKETYLTAKFINDTINGDDEKLIKSLNELVTGLLLSKALYLQGNNIELMARTFNGYIVYLDTYSLLCCLNLKSDAENQAVQDMMLMFTKSNIRVKCFGHTFDELKKAILAYKDRRLIKHELFGKTLEFFDNNNYDAEQVDDFVYRLKAKLSIKGIEIVETPKKINENTYDIYGEYGSDFLKKLNGFGLQYDAIDHDIKALIQINIIRQNNKYDKIEDSKAIFICDNNRFVYASNKILGYTQYIGLSMSSTDFLTILWLKQKEKNINYPLERLGEYSRIILDSQPSDEFLKKLKETVYKIQQEGNISEYDVQILSEKYYLQKEFRNSVNADEDLINKETVDLFITEKVKDDRDDTIKRQQLQIGMLTKELEKERDSRKEQYNNKKQIIDNKIKRITYLISGVITLIALGGLISCIALLILTNDDNNIGTYVGLGITIISLLIEIIGWIRKFKKLRAAISKCVTKILD